jgi:hypothetical protein
MMTNPQEIKDFTRDLELRFDALVHWAMENWPDKSHPLSASDFAECRTAMSIIGADAVQSRGEGLEPDEGGPQYVNVMPTPWP